MYTRTYLRALLKTSNAAHWKCTLWPNNSFADYNFPWNFIWAQQLRHSLMQGPRANVTVSDCSCSISFNDNDSWPVCSVHAIQWRHNERKGVSNHRHLECLLNRMFRCGSKKISKLHVTGPLWGELTGHRWIPLIRASNAENVSIWWRYHGYTNVFR